MLDTSKIYTSNNFGDFKITGYTNNQNVDVEFLSTGYRTTTQACQIISGQVKDKLAPVIFGVAFVGDGAHSSSVNGVHNYAYSVWHHMLTRCYCSKSHKAWPTYKGCTVSSEWLNFQVFAEWFDINYISGYVLDKDILVKGNKVYGPGLCSFITARENVVEARANFYKLRSQNGDVVEVYNLAEFCRNNGLLQSNMSAVCRGVRGSHRGWTSV